MSGNSDPRPATANTGIEASSQPKWDSQKAVITPKTRGGGAIIIFNIDAKLDLIRYTYLQLYNYKT